MPILISADGREFATDSATEVVNLEARGWRVKPEPAPAVRASNTKSEGKNVEH